MPRFARLHTPGTVQHIISRFVNRAFRLRDDIERAEYLRRLDRALQPSDWRLVGYALMSSHVHLVMIAGSDPLAGWIHPVHVGLARWINKRQGTLGPVFSERPTTIVVGDDSLARLLAYVHNNPVRAGLVGAAQESSWTSHGAYLGSVPPVARLDVDFGLQRAGFGADQAGREHFRRHVAELAALSRSDDLTGGMGQRERTLVRQSLGAAIELTSARFTSDLGTQREVLVMPGMVTRPRWAGDLRLAIARWFERVALLYWPRPNTWAAIFPRPVPCSD